MSDALYLANRIVTRLKTIVHDAVFSPTGNDRSCRIKAQFDGDVFLVEIEEISERAEPRPFGFDHLTGDRPRVDQIRIAEMAAKSLAGLARVSKEDADVAELDVWHKRGIAGFIVRTTDGTRHVVTARPFGL